jgi:hypothetical protein
LPFLVSHGLAMPLGDNAHSMLRVFESGIALIGICSVPAFGSTVTRLRKRDAKQDVYEDGDGKATPESVKAYSGKLPKSCIVVSAGVGLATSIALLITSPHADDRVLINSLSIGAWVSGAVCYIAVWGVLLAEMLTLVSRRSSCSRPLL